MRKLKLNLSLVLIFFTLVTLFLLKSFNLLDFLKFSVEGQVISSRFQEFITLFLSIVVEAFPFIVLGVIISILVALFVKAEWLTKILPRNRFLNHFFISFFGVLMPVCECGNIPVARRLISKGFNVSQSMTFLLAAPIINPVTLWSTYEAFRPDITIVLIRIISALFIANFIGIILSYKKDQNSFLTQEFYKEVCSHDDFHHNKLEEAIDIFQREFMEMFKLLCIGALFAALSQVFIPREVITSIGSSPFLSIIAMIVFAFIISICSNVDAFVVLPYLGTFTIGSIASYLVFGPMIDMKILTMLKSSFRLNLLIFVTLFVTLFSILIGLAVNYFI